MCMNDLDLIYVSERAMFVVCLLDESPDMDIPFLFLLETEPTLEILDIIIIRLLYLYPSISNSISNV
jgi:hypothetical protein